MAADFTQIPDEWADDRRIGDGAFRLLVLLAKFSRFGSTCTASNEGLAEMMGVTAREIRRRLDTLEGLGYIKRGYHDTRRRHRKHINIVRDKNVRQKDVEGHYGPSRRTHTSVQKDITVPLEGHYGPHKKIEREEEREREPGGSNSTLAIAEKIVREVWHVTDEFEVETQAGTIRHYIDGYSEAACLAAAATARGKARDPVRYFVGMCQRGLTDPTKREAPVANGQAPARVAPERETIAQARSRRLREDAEREKVRRAAAQQTQGEQL